MPSITRGLKEKEEKDYQNFKTKYHDRLIKEFDQYFQQKFLQEPYSEIINKIQNMPETEDTVIKKLFESSLTETEHYLIKKASKLNYRFELAAQKHLTIIKKEQLNNDNH